MSNFMLNLSWAAEIMFVLSPGVITFYVGILLLLSIIGYRKDPQINPKKKIYMNLALFIMCFITMIVVISVWFIVLDYELRQSMKYM